MILILWNDINQSTNVCVNKDVTFKNTENTQLACYFDWINKAGKPPLTDIQWMILYANNNQIWIMQTMFRAHSSTYYMTNLYTIDNRHSGYKHESERGEHYKAHSRPSRPLHKDNKTIRVWVFYLGRHTRKCRVVSILSLNLIACDTERVIDEHLGTVTPRDVVTWQIHGPVVQLQRRVAVYGKHRNFTSHLTARGHRRRVESAGIAHLYSVQNKHKCHTTAMTEQARMRITPHRPCSSVTEQKDGKAPLTDIQWMIIHCVQKKTPPFVFLYNF